MRKSLPAVNCTSVNNLFKITREAGMKWMTAFFVVTGLMFGLRSLGQTVVTITTSGSFTIPAGASDIKVEAWGGGGGGGGVLNFTNTRGGGGGGGGAYNVSTIFTSGTYTV